VFRRTVSIFLASYLFIWFAVIIPGHRRGIITVPGTTPTCDCCCCCDQTAASPHAPPQSSKNCAICYFAAHLDIPPVADLSLPPMGLVDRLDPPAAERGIQRIVLMPYHSRGPPA
jgi:hypothetical protein